MYNILLHLLLFLDPGLFEGDIVLDAEQQKLYKAGLFIRKGLINIFTSMRGMENKVWKKIKKGKN